MKLDSQHVPKFDGRLSPNYFIDWLQSVDYYLTLYPWSEAKKVKFGSTKLIRPTSQWWTNVTIMNASKMIQLIQTWITMKNKLTKKYCTYHPCITFYC